MKTINLDEIGDGLIPEGRYVCEIADITEKTTRSGDRLWRVRFRVLNGPHAGAVFFDHIVFAGAGLLRFKGLCEALRLGSVVTTDPKDFLGKGVLVDVGIEDDPKWGRRNKVPFRGFFSVAPPPPPRRGAPAEPDDRVDYGGEEGALL